MSAQTKYRYLNSFFITSVLYLIASFFLFYVFADTIIEEEKKPEEIKISLKHMMAVQEPVPVQPIVEQTPIEPIIEKRIDKPKKEKRPDHKKPEHKKFEHKKFEHKEPMSENSEPKEFTPNVKPVQVDTPQINKVDTNQIENIEATYLSKIRSTIEKNKTYPKVAKRLNQTGKVYIKFLISKEGVIKTYKIEKSSQFESLDNASIEILEKIANFDAIPKELNKDSWEIIVPIIYQINQN